MIHLLLIIYLCGLNTCVNDTSTHILYNNTDFYTSFTNGYNYLNHGQIFLDSGIYNLNRQINLTNNNISINSEGNTTIQSPYSGFNGNCLFVIKTQNTPTYYFPILRTNQNNLCALKFQNARGNPSTITNLISLNATNTRGLVLDSTDGNSILNNVINIGQVGGNNFTGTKIIDLEANTTNSGIMQGNTINWNFIDTARYGVYINQYSSTKINYNTFNGHGIDNNPTPNSYCIFVNGNVAFNYNNIIIDQFVGCNTIIGGTETISGNSNFANLNNDYIQMAFQNSKEYVVGSSNTIINNLNPSNAVNSPFVLSSTFGISHFNNGNYINNHKIYVSMTIPSLLGGQSARFYFYDSLLRSYDSVKINIINGPSNLLVEGTDNSINALHEGFVDVVSPCTYNGGTITAVIDLN